MSTHFLPIFLDNAEYALRDLVTRVTALGADSSASLEVAKLYRIKGISDLFMWGLPDICLDSFHRGGRAYKSWLAQAAEQDKATALGFPFFDAVACGDFDGATAIATLSRSTWNQDEEYEEDFLYMHYLAFLLVDE